MHNDDSPLLRKEEAARLLGISPRSLNRLIADGGIPYYRVLGQVRISRAQIDAYLAGAVRQAGYYDDEAAS